MNEQNEPRYIVDLNFTKSLDSEDCNNAINETGFYSINVRGFLIKIYNGSLAAFLISDKVAVTINTLKIIPTSTVIYNEDGAIYETRETTKTGEVKSGYISGQDYINSYSEGYIEGITWFDKEYSLVVDNIYFNKEVIDSLHYLYFLKNWGCYSSGLVGCKREFNFIISHQDIKRKGYLAGIVSKIEELIENHYGLFKEWENYHIKENTVSGETTQLEIRKRHKSTEERYEKYKSDVEKFLKLEGKGRVAAIESAAHQNRVSIDTIERALGDRK